MATTTRRQALKLTAGGAAGLALATSPVNLLADPPKEPEQAQHPKHPKQPLQPSRSLTPGALRMLPLGSIRPAGWLERQLRLQADGMGGHLDEFWPDVGENSGWLGGTGESWERGPYFLDGLLPLAYLLNDDTLKAKAQRFVDWTLEHQAPDGMIGPATNNDWWPRMVMLKALAQYQEVTGDPRVLPVMTRYFHHQLLALPNRPLREWGKYRWQDEVLVVQWLHDRTRDPLLLDLCDLLRQQGFDWEASFTNFTHTAATPREILQHPAGGDNDRALQTHGVNHGQALKTAAVQYRLSGSATERDAYFRQSDTLDRYHGMPNGMFSCDEHLAGLDPIHGTELCTVVETMFSMEVALATFGDARIADRIEKIAFNALPGTFTDDMWAHQYDQQPNQVQVSLNSKPWTTNGPESNLFGLEPNFGCCTANFHQGWPKFTASLWMAAPDDGLVATLYSPCDVRTRVRGTEVRLSETTDYPFRDTVRITVAPAAAIRFPLSLRIPAWADGASIHINGTPADTSARPGAFARIDRVWNSGDLVEIRLPMQPRLSRWYRQSIALERGPLVFSLQPGGSWVKLRDRGMTADWQVFPTAQWNYALDVDESSVGRLRISELPVGARPFTTVEAAVKLHVTGRRLEDWRAEDGVSATVPQTPVTSSQPLEELTLVPYAGAKLRVTAFPQLTSSRTPA